MASKKPAKSMNCLGVGCKQSQTCARYVPSSEYFTSSEGYTPSTWNKHKKPNCFYYVRRERNEER